MPISIGFRTRRMMATLQMLSLALALPAMAADYDLVINNGRVIDPETMLEEKWESQHLINVPHLHLDDGCVAETKLH